MMMDEEKNKSGIKEKLPDFAAALIIMLLVNLCAILIYFAVMLVLNPFLAELELRGGADTKAKLDAFRAVICVILFYVFLGVISYHNPIEKGRFVNSPEGRNTSFRAQFTEFAKSQSWVQAASYAIFCLPLHIVVSIFPDIKYLPTFFLPQYGFITVTGSVWLSYVVNIAVYTLFMMIFIPLFRRIWDKNRLYK